MKFIVVISSLRLDPFSFIFDPFFKETPITTAITAKVLGVPSIADGVS
ncbi:hypothetical protein IQ244_03195 [Nostoc sp. LEGE 06077]|nr:hypothetical protein [Nostoc sp. LEGE 06077]MBE9205529.1 hypothetical protein [Nostoc sp. LEGE 06077]